MAIDAPAVTEPTAPAPVQGRWARLAAEVKRQLFTPVPARPVTKRGMVLGALAVLAGTVLGLLRTRGPGAFDTIWAEDGNHLLSDALNQSFVDSLIKPLQGYFVLLPRFIAEFTTMFPLDWAPAVLSTCAAAVTAGYALIVYIVSASHLKTRLPRLMVSVPLVASHVAILAVPNNVATLQFATVYVVFWLLLWAPTSRAGHLFSLFVIVGAGFTTLLTMALIPLALLRVWAARDRRSWALLAAVVVPLALQGLALATGVASRQGLSHTRPDPIWAFIEFVLFGFPYGVLGEKWLMPPALGMNIPIGMTEKPTFDMLEHNSLLVLAWLIAIGFAVLAFRRVTNPAWILAIVAFVCSYGIFAVEFMGDGSPNPGYLIEEVYLLGDERYLLAPGMMIVTALTALVLPKTQGDGASGTHWNWPVIAYATLLAIICVGNLRADTLRSSSPSWADTLAEVRAKCATTGESHIDAWYGGEAWHGAVKVPCAKVN